MHSKGVGSTWQLDFSRSALRWLRVSEFRVSGFEYVAEHFAIKAPDTGEYGIGTNMKLENPEFLSWISGSRCQCNFGI